jgi:hypothetical protein
MGGAGAGRYETLSAKNEMADSFSIKGAKFPDFMAISSRCSLING